jgi:arabinose-5-phosphate isomerase
MKDQEKIRATALRVLHAEQEAVQKLHDSINDDFVSTVQLIANCRGRIIVTGIGKSALIGQKIVATFNSTGTAAHFLHAADALHGDLGMLSNTDLLLVLSKSGESPEIKALLASVLRIGCPVLGITSAAESTLAQASTYILRTPNLPEADPHQLAPTTSTTAQLALGDALAIAVLEVKGFSAQDFARVHPGGFLGKQLLLKASELAARHAKPSVSEHATVQEAVVAMTQGRLGAVAVLDTETRVCGIVTDGDLRRMLERGESLERADLLKIMTKNPKCLAHDVLATEALQLMRTRAITQIVLLDEDQKYAGMVHLHDILREGFV